MFLKHLTLTTGSVTQIVRPPSQEASTLSHTVSILETTHAHTQRVGHKFPSGFLFVRMLSKNISIYGIRLLCCFSGWVQPSLPRYMKGKFALGDLRVAEALVKDGKQIRSFSVTAHVLWDLAGNSNRFCTKLTKTKQDLADRIT